MHVANWHISDEFISVNIDRLRVIKSLLAHGADVNGRNTDMEPRWSGARYRRRQVGSTAFLFAAKAADLEVMRCLLANGADPKINTGVNINAVMLAAGIAWASNQDRANEEQVLETVKLLVEELGVDVNFVADTGETALHAAAYRGAEPWFSISSTRARSSTCRTRADERRCRSLTASSTEIHLRQIRRPRCCCASSGQKKFPVRVCARTSSRTKHCHPRRLCDEKPVAPKR